jgi:hypothetical protein
MVVAVSRPTYLYRLEIVYPEGSVFDPERPEDRRWLDWEPENWQGWGGEWDGNPDHDDSFRWPRTRLFLSQTAAKRRAELFEKYGAKVTIERSEAVTWTRTRPSGSS